MEEKSEAIRWINRLLKGHDYKTVTHLEAELADGITLLRLVQIVVDEQLPRHFLRPVMRVQKVENLKLSLQFLQDRGIEVTGVKAEDLADGDIHSILLLIQQLREWHDTMGGSEEETVSSTASDSVHKQPRAGGRGILEFSVTTKDDIAILNWVAEMIHRDLPSYSALSDGRVLCNLVNTLSPGAVDIRRISSALPVERIQMALAAAQRHLDVSQGNLVSRSFAEGRDSDKLRHYLEQLQRAHQLQVKKREEQQRQRRVESQLEEERDRRQAKEKRLQQQQQRATERQRHNLVADRHMARSRESLDPVENLAHQAQKEKEQQERTDRARTEQERLQTSYKARLEQERREVAKQVEQAEMRERERVERERHERLQRLQEEQEKREQLQKQRMDEERKKRVREELKRHEQMRQRRQSQQQTYLERHKQQIRDSHGDEREISLSPSDVVRRAAASASGVLAETHSLLSRASNKRPSSSSSRDKSMRRSTSSSHVKRPNKHNKGLKRRAVSMTDFRTATTLDTIEEERRSSGSSTPSEEKSIERTLSEGDIRLDHEVDDYNKLPSDPIVLKAVQKDNGVHIQQASPQVLLASSSVTSSLLDHKKEARKPMSGLLVVKPEHDSTARASSIPPDVTLFASPAGTVSLPVAEMKVVASTVSRDSTLDVPVELSHSQKQHEPSNGWKEILERRLVELEESNAKLQGLLEQERKRRVRHWVKRRGVKTRKQEMKARLDYMSRVSRLASQKIQDYDACMVTFSRKLAHLQSDVAGMFEQSVSRESEEVRFARDELFRRLNDKIKTLTEKVESVETMTKASSVHESAVDPAAARDGTLGRRKKSTGDTKEHGRESKTSRPFLGSLNPFGKARKSYHQSYQQIENTEASGPSILASDAYSQSQVHLRQSDRPRSSRVQIQRRDSLYKLASFFGHHPPHDLHAFLDGLGYGHYADVFDREHVSIVELQHMSEDHLAQMGIPLGPRVVIVKALKETAAT